MASTSTTTSTPTRPGRRARIAALALLGLAPLTNCMCANVQRNRAYRRELHAQIDDYVHTGTRATVADQARELVSDHGHPLAHWDGRDPAATGWKTDDDRRSRHRMELESHAGGFAVRLTEEFQTKAPPTWVHDSSRRDPDVEGAVLERVHPGRREGRTPAQIEAQVYDVAPSMLWEATREELLMRGEILEHHDAPIDVTAHTLWVIYDGDDPSRVRHEISIVRVSDAAHRLEVHRVLERGEGPRPWQASGEERDYDLELTLIRHRDSSAAKAMEAEARRKGDEAYEDALDSGALACGR